MMHTRISLHQCVCGSKTLNCQMNVLQVFGLYISHFFYSLLSCPRPLKSIGPNTISSHSIDSLLRM